MLIILYLYSNFTFCFYNIPPVEEIRELESELTLEEVKKQNQEYILSNLDKYVIDVHGNFFHIDEDNNEIVYCKVCENNNTRIQKPHQYTRKGGNTSNIIAHLCDKHGIIKDNHTN